MSNNSDGSKNDPLFERLFAEAEACLDKNKKTPQDADSASEVLDAGNADTQAPARTPKTADLNRAQVGERRVQRDTVEALKMGLSLRPQPKSPQHMRPSSSARSAGRRGNEGEDALTQAEAKVEKLKGRLASIKDRSKRDQQMALSKQSDKMLTTFLGLIDDLERALGATVESELDSPQFEAYRVGIKQVYDSGQHILNQYGVEKFDSENEPFDPSRHEAVRQEPRNDMEPNRVAEVFQAGYLIEERLLRAARVSVSVTK